ncbi:hypothetical protein FOS14_20585 [Skermania sp. ID1734]|uniref:hypothetical protein n=1 Tax=Skermania sp. ID1734 TaxID=2597516 RepID=UPI00117D48F7|nr:hypothetical protein [Skermania sp. ID1734]TSD94422.1 hypothetical protein FOS14_20585 [Skermania sp. ID1734]
MSAASESIADTVSALRTRSSDDRSGAQEAAWAQIVELQELAKTDKDTADERLNELFRLGGPVRDLDGPTDGILVMTTTNTATDAAVKLLTSMWMPWDGKRFDAATGTGDNRMTDSSAVVSKLIWPLYSMKKADKGKLAFDFKTYVEAGKDDPDREVMVIDYADIESNPTLIIRSIRDELVEIVPGAYLGKILFRLPNGNYSKIGYFALRT